MIAFNMILHVFCIMNEGSEGIGEQEVDVRPVLYVQAVCILQLSPVLCSIHCLTILHFDNIILHCLHF